MLNVTVVMISVVLLSIFIFVSCCTKIFSKVLLCMESFFLTRILNSEPWIATLHGGLLIVMTFLFDFILFLLTLTLCSHATCLTEYFVYLFYSDFTYLIS